MNGLEKFAGHIAVTRLMKRVILVSSTAKPSEVELMVEGPAAEDLDERKTEWINGDPITSIRVWTPRHGKEKGAFGRMFHETAKRVLGHDVEMMHADRRQLYKMCAFLVMEIDKHPPRENWYPDGWRENYDAISAVLRRDEKAAAE